MEICLHAGTCKRIDILKVNYIINILIIVTFLVSPGRSLNNTFSEYVKFYTVQLRHGDKGKKVSQSERLFTFCVRSQSECVKFR